jgi:Zn-dependent oligopeptidase
MRRASFEGLRSIETFALDQGFAEILKLRNRFARRLGFLDFYDYKVWWAEGFDKATLFNLLDDLETRTRNKAAAELHDLERRLGRTALEPWNLNYHTWGSVQEEREPYFGFEDAVERWARTFYAMGVRYRNARVTLDLLDRRGKYENGFMHGPGPAFFRRGDWSPAEINFTANAVPGQVGSGQRAAETLFHEGGHAAHFANILMDAPCFSQEYSPTSVALAETQSMFMDRLLDDADWQTRYARDAQGRPMPFDLIERTIRLTHPYEAQNIRHLLTVCYVEKALFESADADLTPDGILSTIRGVEKRLVQIPGGCPRPTLSVPHLLSWESSGYYHGYVLAMMAVSQTRKHFFEKYGHILDNPSIGRDLSRTYWAPGNSRGFLDMIQAMTGHPFSADAFVEEIADSTENAVRKAREQVDRLARIPEAQGQVDLDLRLRVIDGVEVVVEEGKQPLEAARTFRDWILERRTQSAKT